MRFFGSFFLRMTSRPSRFEYSLLAVVLLGGVCSGSAHAVVIDLNLSTDPSLGTITNVVDVNGYTGELWTSEVLSFNPVTIDEGDEIRLNVDFTGGLGLELASGDFFFGYEEVGFLIRPLPGISVVGETTLNTLFGVSGDLDAVLPFTVGGFTTGGQLAGPAVRDFTDTAFLFQGFNMDTTYSTLTGGPVTVSSLEVFTAASDITIVSVPEPSALILVGSGLIGVLGHRRRRTKIEKIGHPPLKIPCI